MSIIKDTNDLDRAIELDGDELIHIVQKSNDKTVAISDLKTELLGGWRDLISPFSSARTAGTNDPTFADCGNGIYVPRFGLNDRVFVYYHVDHDYLAGSKAYPHVHWFMDGVPTLGQEVTWRISYTIAKGHGQGETLTDTLTSFDVTYTCTGSEVAGEHLVTECSDAQALELIEPDTVLLFEYKLQAENVTPNIFGIMGDLHYQTGAYATPYKAPTFY